MSNNTKTLWQLLNERCVIIPIIQRDYAQGRKGKEYIRRLFLNEVKSYLDNNDEDKTLTLDFVYGSDNELGFMPIDGQQRLTTLWLLHWYIALKTKRLDDNNVKKTLVKFTYKTRDSSKDFCKALCEREINFNTPEGIVKHIKNQSWFFSSWLQDPTVCAMLRTLGGSGESKDDNIESVFRDGNFEDYWEKLTKIGKITFELMSIGTEQLPISDDLYIKMNARGKSLTDFENFKADLIGWINNDEHPDKDEFSKENNSKLTLKQEYALKLDADWTVIFWNETQKHLKDLFDGRIDDVYFEFINRFILNKICLKIIKTPGVKASFFRKNIKIINNDDKEAYNLVANDLDSFNTLYGIHQYQGFSVYKEYINAEMMGSLSTVFNKCIEKNVLSEISSILEEIKNPDTEDENNIKQNEKYSFIPRYNDKLELNSTGLKERVYFYAVCVYLETCDQFEPESFKKWMRICRNLIENGAIDAVPAMVTCLNLVDSIANNAAVDYSWDIYSCLQNYEPSSDKSRLSEQLTEEIEKATEIIKNPNIEDAINNVEKHAFFNGTIRFLFRNASGQIDWDNFAKKKENAIQILFDNSNEVKAETIKKYLKQFSRFHEDIYFSKIGYSRKTAEHSWKTYILSDYKRFPKQVEQFLLNQEQNNSGTYADFLESGLVEEICNRSESFKYHMQQYGDNYQAIHKYKGQLNHYYLFVSNNRLEKNRFLYDIDGISIKNKHIVKNNCVWVWGWKISFNYNGHEYIWNLNDRYNEQISLASDENNFFIWKKQDKNEFIEELNNLLL